MYRHVLDLRGTLCTLLFLTTAIYCAKEKEKVSSSSGHNPSKYDRTRSASYSSDEDTSSRSSKAGRKKGQCTSSTCWQQSNIVILLADQMRAQAMGCMGNTLIRTPNVDNLASQGFLTTNAYSSQPVCTPYRAQLMTGRYGWNTGVTKNDIKLPDNETTIAEILKDNGYATGYVGKWHLNGNRKGFVEIENRQGFDFWAALSCSHNYFNTRYYYDDPANPVEIVDGYEPRAQTDEAIGFIERNTDRPFFLIVSYGPPHNPYQPPEEYDIYEPSDVPLRPNVPVSHETVARGKIAKYYGLISSVDDMVGRVMRSLDNLDLTDNTLVVFTSDHGDMLHSHGQTLKQRPYEEASNIPFIVRYPESVPPGKVGDLLISSVDVLPTLLGLVGFEAPANVDGRNLAEFITGEHASNEPESLLLYNDPYKGNNPGWSWRAIREKEWKYAISPNGGWLLFNVKDDPYEMINLIDDPSYCHQRGHLHDRLVRLREWHGDAEILQYSKVPPDYSDPRHFRCLGNQLDGTTGGCSSAVKLHRIVFSLWWTRSVVLPRKVNFRLALLAICFWIAFML